eukprot:TRINITY_DN17352_c0_g3_i1.p1 TRINITY_DN17352_c0_g3~~TRINITY_DN17352_c0_g3_i1.p1  ORF type:complete len:245 (+),score=69.43 TRINITY_DN17352_c0_g3_i1:76-810(+)
MAGGPPSFTHYLVLDFEASGHDRNSWNWEIIEFPCVIVDAAAGRAVPGGEFHRYVRPTRVPQLSEFAVRECGIAQATVDKADAIDVVLRDFVKWVAEKAAELGMARFACVTCGDYDLKTALPAEVRNKSLPPLPSFLKRWVNIKHVFGRACWQQDRKGPGMAGMLSLLKLPLVGRHHSGIDDTRNIAQIVLHLLAAGVDIPVTFDHAHGGHVDFAVSPLPVAGAQPRGTAASTPAAKKKKSRVQ